MDSPNRFTPQVRDRHVAQGDHAHVLTHLVQELVALDGARAAERRVVEAEVAHLRGWVPSFRWLLGHARRKLLGRPHPVLPPEQPLPASEQLALRLQALYSAAAQGVLRDMLIVNASALFDREAYAAKAGLRAGEDPVLHYLLAGERQGLDPGPDFDVSYYIDTYPEVVGCGLGALVHFETIGRPMGMQPRLPIRLSEIARQVIADNVAHDPDVSLSPARDDPSRLDWVTAIKTDAMSIAWRRMFPRLIHRPRLVIFMANLDRGGAEYEAINVANACKSLWGVRHVLVVATDSTGRAAETWLDPEIDRVFLPELSEGLSHAQRVQLVETLIFALEPLATVNFNSRACWDAFVRKGKVLSTITRLQAALFCRDYDDDGRAIGYADTHFPAAQPFLASTTFDNQAFLNEMRESLPLEQRRRAHLTLLRHPPPQSLLDSAHKPAGPAGRPRVLWAGRLCRQKNIELLESVVRVCPAFDFHVYGAGVTAYEHRLMGLAQDLPNLQMHGGFAEFSELPLGDFSAFLFTSRWEGLPNVLVAAAAAGLPIVASDVGGVGELVDATTGWPIATLDDPLPYKAALDAILAGSADVSARHKAMQSRIKRKFGPAQFRKTLTANGGLLDEWRPSR